MGYTPQQVADRLEIGDLLTTYSYAIDAQDWDALDGVFTPDAHIDYTATGGPAGSYPEIKVFLPKGLGLFRATQHLIGQSKVVLGADGDTASGRTACHNPMQLTLPDGTKHTFVCGVTYADRYARTDAGWRIVERVEEIVYWKDLPPGWEGLDQA